MPVSYALTLTITQLDPPGQASQYFTSDTLKCMDFLTQLKVRMRNYNHQCGPQNLNIEGIHMVKNGSHTYFTNN